MARCRTARPVSKNEHSHRNVRHRQELKLFTSTISHAVLLFYHLALRCTSGLEPAPCPTLAIMDFLQSTQFDSAIALQTLALPMTLILCITSMLRERSISQQDEKRLVRLYKQHAFMFELVQFFVALMACGFVAGNTVAALEARALVIDFASEDVTATIVRSAISRNVWLVASAWCVLACVSMLDSWSLPGSLGELTEPMFRLTREVVRGCEYRFLSVLLFEIRLMPFQISGDTTNTRLKSTTTTITSENLSPTTSNSLVRHHHQKAQSSQPEKAQTPQPSKRYPSNPLTQPVHSPPKTKLLQQRLPHQPRKKPQVSQTSTL
jgi:hypothetical protein